MEEIRKELLKSFGLEFKDHLKTLTSGIMAIEKEEGKEAELIPEMFRAAHSLKGAARAVELTSIEALAHRLEDLLGGLKDGRLEKSPGLFDLLLGTTDAMEDLFSRGIEKEEQLFKAGYQELLDALDAAAGGAAEITYVAPKRVGVATGEDGSIRIPTEKLDVLLDAIWEMTRALMQADSDSETFFKLLNAISGWKRAWTRLLPLAESIKAREIESPELEKILTFLEEGHERIISLEKAVIGFSSSMKNDQRRLGRMNRVLVERAQELRMLPVSRLFDAFPRLVRDTARDFKKDVELVTRGSNVEVDRRVIELLKDPLVHLLRNAVVHGIEDEKTRLLHKKPAKGRISVTAVKLGNVMEISVEDDGAGIDLASIKKAAVEKGLAGNEDMIHEKDLLNLIFHPGISSRKEADLISGRGVGLDVVRKNIERIQGTVRVESKPFSGTCFTLSVPVATTSAQFLVVEVLEQIFAIPSSSILALFKKAPDRILSLGGRAAVNFDGTPLPLVSLADLFYSEWRVSKGPFSIAVIGSAEKRCAFYVDRFIKIMDAAIKPLEFPLNRVRYLAGAFVSPEGKTVPVVDPPELFEFPGTRRGFGISEKKDGKRKKRILVADDSITTRTLVKSILESEGYDVHAVADGAEGWRLIKEGGFDVLVSDVEMPVTDGIELTRKVKSAPMGRDIPVILVTAKETTEDRIRGLEAGADAYIKKSSFDQRRLIETIERFTR